MDSIETLLEKIRPRPQLFIGEPDIDRLYLFLLGYDCALKQNGSEPHDLPFFGFNEYLAEKFQDSRTFGWNCMIKEHCPEENGVDAFFRLWDEYREYRVGQGGMLDRLFQKSDLIPVVVQDLETKDVLMVGFTNREAVRLTLETKTAWFWSRSRQKLWNKGESSGHFLHVKKMVTDCDTDTLLYFCVPDGPTCHTGARSCFFEEIQRFD